MGAREYIVVSGYYGFDNLGDEAILEELIAEVGRLVDKSKIVVLSRNPEKTSSVFAVKSIDRWSLPAVQSVFQQARLFISGGGGLYQDVSSIKSVAYYAGLAFLARINRVPTLVYAQGIGPLKSPLSVFLTKSAMKQAQRITVRDQGSIALLDDMGVGNARLTADPVWCLAAGELPAPIASAILDARNGHEAPFLIGLSLRECSCVTKTMIEDFARAIASNARAGSVLIPLVLQRNQDLELLDAFAAIWRERGLKTINLDCSQLRKPSQWISLLAECDLVIGMRFHALLMALKSGVPTVGLAYDPKVAYLMKNFDQPSLNLAKGLPANAASAELAGLLNDALVNISELRGRAEAVSSSQKELACQNFEEIARILES